MPDIKNKQKVLIIGGQGRIGYSVAGDLATYTDAEITITGRRKKQQNLPESWQFVSLNLEDRSVIKQIIPDYDLVIHCAGPFHDRDGIILLTCIENGINYIDVSDHRSFYERVVKYQELAEKSGTTAILNTGIFPGISNSMVRQGVEQLDTVEDIHLSYVVAGSGGAGLTIMRTTFLGLRKPFTAWLNGKWEDILPYTARETIEFPAPYGKTGVYWFDVPETYTFARSFPGVKNITTKFGSIPDFYNHLTWMTANVFPRAWLQNPTAIEFLSRVSYRMTNVTDRFTGIGVAMRAEVTGYRENKKARSLSTMVHENTAIAAGCGTGSVAQLLLSKQLNAPGIYPIEQALSTKLFRQAMKSRNIEIQNQLSVDN